MSGVAQIMVMLIPMLADVIIKMKREFGKKEKPAEGQP